MSDSLKRRRGGKRERVTPRILRRVASEEPQEHITPELYASKKKDLLFRSVLYEEEYNHLRPQLRDAKMREAAAYKIAVAEGKCPEFLMGKREAEEAMEKKRDINQVQYELKMAQIMDEFEAETLMNQTQHNDKYIYAKNRYIDFFNEIIAEKQRREQQLELVMASLIAIPPTGSKITEHPIVEKPGFDVRTTRSRSKSQRDED